MPRSREARNAYMRQYMKSWYDRRHAQAIEQLGGKCTWCGSTGNLQFDHIDPVTKTMTIAKMWTASELRFQAELMKCQLLCELHHKEKTREEISVPHGGGVSGKRNCPCMLCKHKKAQYMAAYTSGAVPDGNRREEEKRMPVRGVLRVQLQELPGRQALPEAP